jgi:outer membrane protein assembly factor BamD (BamD/ComL family)
MKKILLAVMFILAASFAAAEDKKLFDFADSLYSSGDYYRAIGEYKRYVFYNPAGKFAEKAALKIILSYLSAEKWDGAIEAFEKQDREYSPGFRGNSLILAAYAYSAKKDFSYSEMLLTKAAAGSGAPGLEQGLYEKMGRSRGTFRKNKRGRQNKNLGAVSFSPYE